jgi:hypothetical protein
MLNFCRRILRHGAAKSHPIMNADNRIRESIASVTTSNSSAVNLKCIFSGALQTTFQSQHHQN